MPSLSQTLVFVFAVAACCGLLKMLNEFSLKKFRHDFFGKGISITGAIAVALFLYGDFGRRAVIAADNANLDGVHYLTLMGIAVVIVIGMVIHNIVKTNLVCGIIGSALQIVALPTLAAWKVLVFSLELMWDVFCSSTGSKTTYRRDNSEEEHQKMLQSDIQKTSSSYRFKNDKDSLY